MLVGKTQNSEVLMLGPPLMKLWWCEKGTQEGGREGEEREGETPNAISCGFSTGPASNSNSRAFLDHNHTVENMHH